MEQIIKELNKRYPELEIEIENQKYNFYVACTQNNLNIGCIFTVDYQTLIEPTVIDILSHTINEKFKNLIIDIITGNI